MKKCLLQRNSRDIVGIAENTVTRVMNCPEKKEGTIKCMYCGTEGHSKFKCELKKAHQKGLGKDTTSLAI